MGELRLADLAFTAAESQELMAESGITLSAAGAGPADGHHRRMGSGAPLAALTLAASRTTRRARSNASAG